MKSFRVEPTANRLGVHNTIRPIADAIGQDWRAGTAFVAAGWREAELLSSFLRKPAGVTWCSIGKD